MQYLLLMEFFKGWYACLSSDEVGLQQPVAVRRLGLDMVVWRDASGKPVVMKDLCPHRSVKLSLGTVGSGTLSCAFHGFQFGSDGACTLVPETGNPAANLKCQIFRACENNGLIWLWHGPDDEVSTPPPWFDELDDSFAYSQYTSTWPCHVTRCIENQLDYAHLPFVHASTIGSGMDVRKVERNFELTDFSVKLQMRKGHFIFKFPNIWSLQILPDKFYQFVAFAPIDDKNTKLYVRAYQKFITIPVARELLGLVMNYQSKKILAQDERVVVSHPRHPSTVDVDEKLYPSDQGIVWFRKRWSEMQ